METILLAIEARFFQYAGLFWLLCGLILGHDPLTTMWQAAAAGFACMLIGGLLLRIAVNHLGHYLAELLAEEANEQPEAAES